MTPKHLIAIGCALLCLTQSTEAQLLKKIKDKVNKTINNDDKKEEQKESDDSSTNSNSNNSSSSSNNSSGNSSSNRSDEKTKGAKWCDGLETAGGGSGSGGTVTKEGVEYKKVFSNPNGFQILYDESTLSLKGNSKNFRIVVSERANNKTQYKVIENGEVVATGSEVKATWLVNSSGQASTKEGVDEHQAAMSKYIVGDTMKQDIAKSAAKNVTIQKTDDDQMEMALNIARQTDEYKEMSDAEKKEFEETVKQGIAKNNEMAGTSYNIPASQGGTVAMVNGYFLVVKGKKYGKFTMPPIIDVSKDETKVFAVGVNEQAKPVLIANGKTTPLDENKYSAMVGKIVRSADGNKFVYLEQKKMNEKELEEYTNAVSSNKKVAISYNVIKSDGSTMMVGDPNYSGKFKLTNSGALVYINEETGEVFADNKSIGRFPLKSGDRVDSDAVLMGTDITKITLYNGSEGSLTYLDGSVKKLDIIYPRVVTEGGKAYMSWFRKCGNDIYIAKFAY